MIKMELIDTEEKWNAAENNLILVDCWDALYDTGIAIKDIDICWEGRISGDEIALVTLKDGTCLTLDSGMGTRTNDEHVSFYPSIPVQNADGNWHLERKRYNKIEDGIIEWG